MSPKKTPKGEKTIPTRSKRATVKLQPKPDGEDQEWEKNLQGPSSLPRHAAGLPPQREMGNCFISVWGSRGTDERCIRAAVPGARHPSSPAHQQPRPGVPYYLLYYQFPQRPRPLVSQQQTQRPRFPSSPNTTAATISTDPRMRPFLLGEEGRMISVVSGVQRAGRGQRLCVLEDSVCPLKQQTKLFGAVCLLVRC